MECYTGCPGYAWYNYMSCLIPVLVTYVALVYAVEIRLR